MIRAIFSASRVHFCNSPAIGTPAHPCYNNVIDIKKRQRESMAMQETFFTHDRAFLQIPDRESRLHGVLEPPSRSFRATFTE